MANTVGELKKLLGKYPDDLHIAFLDDEGNYVDDLKVIEERTLGIFSRGQTPELKYYRTHKFLENEIWYEDRRVLVLG